LVLTEPTGRLHAWLQHTLTNGAHHLATAAQSPRASTTAVLQPSVEYLEAA
jgi:hypothetical protein